MEGCGRFLPANLENSERSELQQPGLGLLQKTGGADLNAPLQCLAENQDAKHGANQEKEDDGAEHRRSRNNCEFNVKSFTNFVKKFKKNL